MSNRVAHPTPLKVLDSVVKPISVKNAKEVDYAEQK